MGHVITLAQQKGGSGKTTVAINLAVAFARQGSSVALVDTDPQGSMGRWFMARRDAGRDDLSFSTASAWGVPYECDKLSRTHDFVIIDTPPKVDSDLRPALRESDLVLVPVAASQVDVWATEAVLELAARERRPAMVLLNRAKSGARVTAAVAEALAGLDAAQAETVLGNRVAYAEALGLGQGVLERPKGPWSTEVEALAQEISAVLTEE